MRKIRESRGERLVLTSMQLNSPRNRKQLICGVDGVVVQKDVGGAGASHSRATALTVEYP